MKTLGEKLDDVFASAKRGLTETTTPRRSRLVEEEEFQANVKKDPNTANVSGQKPVAPGDLEDDEAMKQGDVGVSDIIDKLNAIRAGRSVKDDEIAKALEAYFMDLDPAERVALFAYLKGISEVVSGQTAGEAAVEPADPAPGIKMQKKNSAGGESNKASPAPHSLASRGTKSNVTVTVNKSHAGGGQESAPITPKTR
jgi:ribosomal protein L12E/L44/L45/RPP1/RPP2